MSIFGKKGNEKLSHRKFGYRLWEGEKGRGSKKGPNRAERMALRHRVFGRRRFMSKEQYKDAIKKFEKESNKIESLPKQEAEKEKVAYLKRIAGMEK